MSDIAHPIMTSWESLTAEVRRRRELMEDLEDLMELRAAVEPNSGKAGTPWEQVKSERELE